MTLNKPSISTALRGAIGGALGAAAGHSAVDISFRITGDANAWFKGPHGPPFFSLTVNTSVYYACLAAILAARGARLKAASGAFAAAFLPIWLIMSVSTHAFSWGEAPNDPPTMAWVYLIFVSYFLTCAAATWTCGALRAVPPRLKAGLGALGGGSAAYIVSLFTAQAFPVMREVILEPRLLAPWTVLLNGSLAGIFIGLGSDRT